MKHTIVGMTALLAALGAFPGAAYDAELAGSYATLFAPCEGAQTGKALHFMKPEAFVKAIKGGEAITALDMRTPREAGVLGMTLPGAMAIPLDELFVPASLDRIPRDHKVVVVCKSGSRAAAAGTALRHVGFDNVYILKGGLKALSGYLGAKEAY